MTSPLLALDALREEPSTSFARALLAGWSPRNPAQALERDRIVAWIDRYPADAHRRTRLEGHLTASVLVVDPERGAGLLTHHRKLGRWLQLGGHCDGDANLARAALREAVEESGIADLRIDPHPLDVDVHAIPARPGEPEHWHLDTRFLVLAPPGCVEALSEESLALRWFRPDELVRIPTDGSVQRLFEAAFGVEGQPGRLRAGSGQARPL
ncbi:MAG: NUDIX hydrolase [Planctomycetota bacterium]|nr:NUDIX hydrolase [Planctomycetota bacterium]